MDPNITLSELREHVRLVNDPATSRGARATHAEWAVEKFKALDEWLSSGGFSPSPWSEAQRRALEATRPSQPKERCWESTLAGTQVPVPCPEPPTVDDVLEQLEPDPWGQRGAYDDPAVQRAISEHVRGDA